MPGRCTECLRIYTWCQYATSSWWIKTLTSIRISTRQNPHSRSHRPLAVFRLMLYCTLVYVFYVFYVCILSLPSGVINNNNNKNNNDYNNNNNNFSCDCELCPTVLTFELELELVSRWTSVSEVTETHTDTQTDTHNPDRVPYWTTRMIGKSEKSINSTYSTH